MDAAGLARLKSTTAVAIGRAWASALVHLRDESPVSAIEARLRTGDPVTGLDAAIGSFAAAELVAYNGVGAATATWATEQVREPEAVRKKVIYYDSADPSVMSWAERNRLDLVRGLTMEQRVMIRYALSIAQETGENPRVTAQRIRDGLGLTETHLRAVDSYRTSLERGQYAAALDRQMSDGRSDRTIRSAQDADRELTPAQIDAAVERYRNNMIAMRAETIARTETQRITHQASDELYRQAIARGDLDAEQLECEWLHHPGKQGKYDREFHISMHGQKRAWGESFVSGLGNELAFPGDPDAPAEETIRCACTRTVRILPPARVANAA